MANKKAKPQTTYITPDGFRMLRDEMLHLQTVERPKVVTEVSDAAAQGDRSENAEYIYGKKRLREIDRRVRFLSKKLEFCTVVDPREQSGDRVFFGATVVLEEDDKEFELKIVGVDETDPSIGKVSYRSPIGRALLGKEVDDEVRLTTPKGVRELYIVEVRYE